MKYNELVNVLEDLSLSIDLQQNQINDLTASNDWVARSNEELAEAITELIKTIKEIKK